MYRGRSLTADQVDRSRASRRKSTKKWRGKIRASGLCGQCGVRLITKNRSSCGRCLSAKKEKYNNDPKYTLAAVKKRREELRREVFSKYDDHGRSSGPSCRCCRETEPVFLTIDHVNGGGNKHRREIGQGGTALHRWLKRNGFPDGFQILCWNCNFAKHVRSRCPHKDAIR